MWAKQSPSKLLSAKMVTGTIAVRTQDMTREMRKKEAAVAEKANHDHRARNGASSGDGALEQPRVPQPIRAFVIVLLHVFALALWRGLAAWHGVGMALWRGVVWRGMALFSVAQHRNGNVNMPHASIMVLA